MVTNIEVKTGVNIILNIVHLIAFTRSDILLFHDTWVKELYSQGFRIDADVIVFLVFTSFFFTGFSWFLQYFKKNSFENLELRLFLRIWGGNGLSFACLCHYFIHIVHIVWDIFYLNKTTRVDSPTLPRLWC